ncbi:MAG: LysR family transcriptional regulator [Treponema sp.]|nr:LysR family transcriptional regulator [Treponema sp.]
MDINNVLAVHETLSFTKAAERLHISQSAVSQSIAKLEKELNILLFVRNNNKLYSTPACEIFLETGRQILKLCQKLESDMGEISGRYNSFLRIGISSFFFWLLSNRSKLIRELKKLDFQYEFIQDRSANIEKMVENSQLDFGFVRAPVQNKLLECEPLFTEKIMLAVSNSHPICKSMSDIQFPTIDLKEFQNEPFIMINNPRITPICMKLCEDADIKPVIALHTSSWDHVYDYIKTGRAVGFLSCLYAEKDDENRPVRLFNTNSPHAYTEHVVAYLSQTIISPNARKFINMTREYIVKMLPV